MLFNVKILLAALTMILASCAEATETENIQGNDIVMIPKQVKELKEASKLQHNYTEKDKFCLAKNIYHEARGENEHGKRAVAQVTLNRVKSPKFKNTICGVVYERNQFSWTKNRTWRWSIPSGKAWAESQQLADKILSKGRALDNMDGALFFHSTRTNPGWKKRRLAIIGNHIFYG